jgi:cyclase
VLKKRLITSLILRHGMVVQSVAFKHTNVIGDAITAVQFFNQWSTDEIVLLDVSRDLSHRERFYPIVENLSRKCFVPLTVGGWVTTIEEIRRLLSIGADKVVINTAALARPALITEAAATFGSQCVVISIDVRRTPLGEPEVHADRGRLATGWQPTAWAEEAVRRGAGELYVTSIDHDGMRGGYDLALTRAVADAVDVPVIAFGGVGRWEHLVDGIRAGGAEAVAAANIFHYTELSARKAKEFMRTSGIDVR